MSRVPKEMGLDYDPDDVEMNQTPPDVVRELGFDPADPDDDEIVSNYSPHQPRDKDGQWTSGGGGGGGGGGSDTPQELAGQLDPMERGFYETKLKRATTPEQEARVVDSMSNLVAKRKLEGDAGQQKAVDTAKGVSFTAEEHTAVRGYVSEAKWDSINTRLRKGKDHKDAADIDSAISKSTPLGKDTTLYRGIGMDTPPSYKVGGVIQDKAFMSTTAKPSAAIDFSRGGGQKHAVVMTIDAPKGTHALNTSRWVSGGLGDEGEMLLPRGSSLKVRGVRRIGSLTIVDTDLQAD